MEPCVVPPKSLQEKAAPTTRALISKNLNKIRHRFGEHQAKVRPTRRVEARFAMGRSRKDSSDLAEALEEDEEEGEGQTEGEEEEGEEQEQTEEGEGEEIEARAGAEAETPAQDAMEPLKLAEGYFEIEAIRRRRLRKGQLQYLVKWLVTPLPLPIYSLRFFFISRLLVALHTT